MEALIGDVRAVHQFLNAQASTLGTMSEKVRDSQCMGLCKKIAVQHLDMTESTKILETLNGGPWSQENKDLGTMTIRRRRRDRVRKSHLSHHT